MEDFGAGGRLQISEGKGRFDEPMSDPVMLPKHRVFHDEIGRLLSSGLECFFPISDRESHAGVVVFNA